MPTPAPPHRGTREQLAAICERICGPCRTSVDDLFAAVAANPLQLARVMTDVRRSFGMLAEGLPIHEDGRTPTLDALARMIDANLELPAARLVCLQACGTRRPLFLIHAGGGYVFFYRALASRLAPDQPVFAIRAETTADRLGQPFHQCHSIEGLAARYIDDIRAVQPTGPYALGGGSFGGAVAFEMARQLRAAGQDVLPVLIMSTLVRNDAVPEAPALPMVAGIARLRQRIIHHVRHASRLSPGEAVRHVLKTARRNAASEGLNAVRDVRRAVRDAATDVRDRLAVQQHRTRSQPIPPALMYRCAANLKTGNRLLAGYVPRPADLQIVVFRAVNDTDPEPCWRGLARGGMRVLDLPGGHLDLLEEPTVATTAALIRQSLG